ncbi:MAG: hypothetical protein K1X57_19895, partial [Gemmataceae bacterium]|nr:hypothetical protein [Gemmataceae bacterium]
MRRIRILIAGLALVPAAVVPVVWGQQPAKPENYNPVPPQFRGQPTNPTNFNGQAVIPSGTFASPGFRAIGPTPPVAVPPPVTPADPKPADTPKAP